MEPKKVCPYCMTPLEGDAPCAVCGLNEDTYTPSAHHLPPGTVLMERYLIGQVLGEGGFGITYLGCDLRLEMKVAIKECFPIDRVTRISADSLEVTSLTNVSKESYLHYKEKFLREARAMARMVKLPEIVGVRDYFEANNTAYIVMEYLEGTTMRELVEQRGHGLPAAELLQIMKPLFSALSKMHDSNLIHRDISPENLMLEDGGIRLLDFGCARDNSAGSETRSINLKYGYAPIEQYKSKGQGPFTDVYALAATLYYCLTGLRPPQSIERLMEDELVPPRQLGADLTERQEKALLQGMGIRPQERFQSMQEFYEALYALPPKSPKPTGFTLSVFACVLAAILLTAGALLASVRAGTTRSSAVRFANELELSEIHLTVNGETTDAVQYILDSVDDYVAQLYHINAQSIQDLLNNEGIRNFIGQKLYDYMSELCGRADSGTITADEIVSMLRENHDAVQETLHYDLLEADYEEIQRYLENDVDLNAFSVESLFQEHPQTLTAIRCVTSGGTIAALFFFGALLLAAAIWLNRKHELTACAAAGGTCLVCSAALWIVLARWGSLLSALNAAFALGENLYRLALQAVWSGVFAFAIGALAAAALAAGVFLYRRAARAKAKTAAEEPA